MRLREIVVPIDPPRDSGSVLRRQPNKLLSLVNTCPLERVRGAPLKSDTLNTPMNRTRFLAVLLAVVTAVFATPRTPAQNDPAFETTARSLVRMEALANQLAAGIAQQVAERGLGSDDMREKIAVSTADSLRRATVCVKRRFFDGAERCELEERILELDGLAARVETAAARLGLYGYLREKLAAYLNERDWLKRQYGLDRR
jgi:hypothetical protein